VTAHATGRASLPPGEAGLRDALTPLAAGCFARGAWPYDVSAQSRFRSRKAETRRSLKASAFGGRVYWLTSVRSLYCPARLALASLATDAPVT
jgi:hypothetical protein